MSGTHTAWWGGSLSSFLFIQRASLPRQWHLQEPQGIYKTYIRIESQSNHIANADKHSGCTDWIHHCRVDYALQCASAPHFWQTHLRSLKNRSLSGLNEMEVHWYQWYHKYCSLVSGQVTLWCYTQSISDLVEILRLPFESIESFNISIKPKLLKVWHDVTPPEGKLQYLNSVTIDFFYMHGEPEWSCHSTPYWKCCQGEKPEITLFDNNNWITVIVMHNLGRFLCYFML